MTSSKGPSHVVVDGSNIATEGRSLPSLAQLNEAVMAFMQHVNHQRVQRLCRGEALRVRVKKRHRARLGHSTYPQDKKCSSLNYIRAR